MESKHNSTLLSFRKETSLSAVFLLLILYRPLIWPSRVLYIMKSSYLQSVLFHSLCLFSKKASKQKTTCARGVCVLKVENNKIKCYCTFKIHSAAVKEGRQENLIFDRSRSVSDVLRTDFSLKAIEKERKKVWERKKKHLWIIFLSLCRDRMSIELISLFLFIITSRFVFVNIRAH